MSRRSRGRELGGLILLVGLIIATVVLGIVGTLLEKGAVETTTTPQIPANVSEGTSKSVEAVNTTTTTVSVFSN